VVCKKKIDFGLLSSYPYPSSFFPSSLKRFLSLRDKEKVDFFVEYASRLTDESYIFSYADGHTQAETPASHMMMGIHKRNHQCDVISEE
jgi:hypothetical protein